MTLAEAWEIFEFPPGLDRAGLGNRFAARLLDVLVPVPLVLGVVWVSQFTDASWVTTVTLAAIVLVSVLGAYEVGATARYGATLGKRWRGIEVVRMEDLAPPSLGQSFLRWATIATGFGPLVSMLEFFSPAYDGDGRQRGWADKAAGTVVIKFFQD